MFGDVLAEVTGATVCCEGRARLAHCCGEAPDSAAKHAGNALGAAINGLGALLGGGSWLSSGLTFDEQIYAKAKPLILSAGANLNAASQDLLEAMRVVVNLVVEQFGAEVALNMKPYVVRFIADVRDGAVILDEGSKDEGSKSTQFTVEGSRMRIEQHIVASWAAKLSGRAVNDMVLRLEGMEATLSGDSGLENVWEEVCAQVQGEESIDWSTYEDIIVDLLHSVVKGLDRDAQLALWAATDAGWDYIYDHHADKNGAVGAPLDIGAIVAKLKEDVLSAAADYESPSLYRYLWGEDDPEYDEDEEYEEDEDEDEAEEESQEDDDFEDPIIFGIHREQIETFDLESSLSFLRTLVPLRDPRHVWSYKGALSLVIAGYDEDPRELFEIPEVCRYLHGLDQEWPFWFFFLTPSSIRLVGMCLASAVTVAPGKVYMPPENFYRFMERGFGAVNHLFDHYGFPESESEALSAMVSQIFSA
ncbi:hypothetical protein D9M68_501520 [compost metagenome]